MSMSEPEFGGCAPIEFKAEKSGKIFFCACKRSSKTPLCNGTHKTL